MWPYTQPLLYLWLVFPWYFKHFSYKLHLFTSHCNVVACFFQHVNFSDCDRVQRMISVLSCSCLPPGGWACCVVVTATESRRRRPVVIRLESLSCTIAIWVGVSTTSCTDPVSATYARTTATASWRVLVVRRSCCTSVGSCRHSPRALYDGPKILHVAYVTGR